MPSYVNVLTQAKDLYLKPTKLRANVCHLFKLNLTFDDYFLEKVPKFARYIDKEVRKMDAANPPLASVPRYRPINREKNEFRLLTVLPPSNSLHGDSDIDPLAFSADPIHCELQYELLSDLSAKSIVEKASFASLIKILMDGPDDDPETISHAEIFGGMSFTHELTDEENFRELSKERKEALYEYYKSSQKVLENWSSEGVELRAKSFESWLGTWIWALFGSNKDQRQSFSYYALSYVWNEKPQSTSGKDYHRTEALFTASEMTTRATLEATLGTTNEKTNTTPERIDTDFGSSSNSLNEYRQIFVDGVPVLVGKNLEKALRTLREIPEIANGARIWVDALCINQQDIEERNFEVKRMGEIYQKASRVISFLGDESDESGHILEFMDLIGEVAERPQAMASLAVSLLKNMQVDLGFFMAKLLQRTYFKRIWIFQEVVLGGAEGIVICGARRFSWLNLLRCGKLMIEGMIAVHLNGSLRLHPMKSMDEGDEYLTARDLQVGLTNLQMLKSAMFDFQRADTNRQPVLGFNYFWIWIPSVYEASDSRDLIYGMMSLLPSQLTDLVKVSYSTSNRFQDVVRSLAEAYIKSTQSLQWILQKYYTPFPGQKDWPTWVPNLTQELGNAHLKWFIDTEDQACPGISMETFFEKDEASGRNLLVCKGTQIDLIDVATENIVMKHLQNSSGDTARRLHQSIIPDFGDPEEEKRHLSNDHKELISKTHQYGNMEGLKAALNLCLSCIGLELEEGQNIFSFPLDILDDEALLQVPRGREFRDPMISIFNMLRHTISSIPLWGTAFEEFFPQKAADVEPSSYSNPVMNTRAAIFGRFLITESGYIGMTLGSIRSGDEVWLLAGCNVPVLLRKSQQVIGAYELLGGVCIPGIMKGEALNERGDVEFENVSIC